MTDATQDAIKFLRSLDLDLSPGGSNKAREIADRLEEQRSRKSPAQALAVWQAARNNRLAYNRTNTQFYSATPECARHLFEARALEQAERDALDAYAKAMGWTK